MKTEFVGFVWLKLGFLRIYIRILMSKEIHIVSILYKILFIIIVWLQSFVKRLYTLNHFHNLTSSYFRHSEQFDELSD